MLGYTVRSSVDPFIYQPWRKLLFQFLLLCFVLFCFFVFFSAFSFIFISIHLYIFSRVHATLQPALSVGRSVGRSVGPSHFTFFYDFISLTSLLLPKWSGDLKNGPCPPARDFGSRVSGLVLETVHPRLTPSKTHSPSLSILSFFSMASLDKVLTTTCKK